MAESKEVFLESEDVEINRGTTMLFCKDLGDFGPA